MNLNPSKPLRSIFSNEIEERQTLDVMYKPPARNQVSLGNAPNDKNRNVYAHTSERIKLLPCELVSVSRFSCGGDMAVGDLSWGRPFHSTLHLL